MIVRCTFTRHITPQITRRIAQHIARRISPHITRHITRHIALKQLFPLLFSLLAVALSVPALAQSSTASGVASGTIGGIVFGTVVDSASGSPLESVQITLSGSRAVVLSRADGTFAIGGVAAGTYTLQLRRVGYAPSTVSAVNVSVGDRVQLSIKLQPSALRLADVVTTGVADPRAATRVPFSVSRVDSAQLGAVMAADAISQLQGKVAGVAMVRGGAPGTGSDIQLRTPASLFKSTMPLIVVDGVVLSQSNPSVADLLSLDLESAEVVKGAAAASLYGSRAANGVISIRSRRGASLPDGRTEFVLRSEFGTNYLTGKPLFANQHAFRMNDAGQYTNENGTVVPREGRVERADSVRFQDQQYPSGGGATGAVNQLDQFFTGNSFANTSLSIGRSLGSSAWRALVSTGAIGGVVPMDGGYRRTDARISLDQQITPSLLLSLTGSHTRSKRSVVDEGENSPFFDLINQAPDVNLRVPDSDGTRYVFQPDSTSQGARPNPLYMLSVRDWTVERARTLANAELKWGALQWLTVEASGSYDRGDEVEQFHFPRGAKSAIQSMQTGVVRRGSDVVSATNASLSATAVHSVGKLSSVTTARFLLEREERDTFNISAQNLSVVGVPVLEAGQNTTAVSSATSIRTNAGFLSTALDYDSRYIGDFLVRKDGSSLFGENERWQTYYRLSGAWRLAQERWWTSNAIPEFKIRASVGTAGGRPSFADQFESYVLNAGGILTKATLGNPTLKPELATEREMGVDFAIGQRTAVQFTHATTVVRDQLVQVPLSASTGFLSQWQNAGTVKGNTTELTIDLQLFRAGAFTWSTGLVADRARNRITQFDRSCFRTGTVGYRCAGVSVGSMYGATFINNVNQLSPVHAQSHSQFRVNEDNLLVPVGNAQSGERRWGQRVEIDGVDYAWGMPITLKSLSGTDSIVQIGDGASDYRVGWSNSFGWRGLSLYALVDAQVGGDVYNRTKQRMYQYYRSADVDQAHIPEAQRKPTQYYSTLYNANSVVDWFVEDGSYLRLRELAVRYRLPSKIIGAFGKDFARSASIAISGRNLFTITKYSGYDPETGRVHDRVDEFGYPLFRTFSGSMQVDF